MKDRESRSIPNTKNYQVISKTEMSKPNLIKIVMKLKERRMEIQQSKKNFHDNHKEVR